jgi:hypothetical protein
MSNTFEYQIIEAPDSQTPDPDPATTTTTPVRLTPKLLDELAERSTQLKQLRRLVELSRRTPQQEARREKQKARNRKKDAMAKASRKRNRRK